MLHYPNTTNDGNATDYLVGGTADHPKELQFDKSYLVSRELGKTYVKLTVKQYQRIIFNRISADAPKNRTDLFVQPFDETLQQTPPPFVEKGATYDSGNYGARGTLDYIFLKADTYVIQFQYPTTYHDREYPATVIVATDMGILPPKQVVNNGKYPLDDDYYNMYYRLVTKNDGVVTFKDAANGDYAAILYDEDFNIVENISQDSSHDVNVTLGEGTYLMHPTNGNFIVVFNP